MDTLTIERPLSSPEAEAALHMRIEAACEQADGSCSHEQPEIKTVFLETHVWSPPQDIVVSTGTPFCEGGLR